MTWNAARYIGSPYQIGGRGPVEFDCWGLLWWIYRSEFGIILPEYPGITSRSALSQARTIHRAMEEDWEEIKTPFDGCAVGMSQREEIHHVGIYSSDGMGKVVHAWENGIVADTFKLLHLRGFLRIQFYQHRLWLTS